MVENSATSVPCGECTYVCKWVALDEINVHPDLCLWHLGGRVRLVVASCGKHELASLLDVDVKLMRHFEEKVCCTVRSLEETCSITNELPTFRRIINDAFESRSPSSVSAAKAITDLCTSSLQISKSKS